MIKHSGLSPCLLYSAFYVNSVVCLLLSVSYKEFKQHVYNRELITQPTPISKLIQILNLTVLFFSQTHVPNGVIKTILVSIMCITFNLDACKVSFLKIFVNIS